MVLFAFLYFNQFVILEKLSILDVALSGSQRVKNLLTLMEIAFSSTAIHLAVVVLPKNLALPAREKQPSIFLLHKTILLTSKFLEIFCDCYMKSFS